MKKFTVIFIATVLILSFVGLVYYALIHSREIPFKPEKIKRAVIDVPFIEKEIDLTKDISLDTWDSIVGKEIKLMYQVMVLPWPKIVIPEVKVKAFHNKKDIYFYLSWKDDTKDWILGTNKFSDACAVMFPIDDKAQPSSIMMGFIGKANIWQWKASQDREYWLKESPKLDVYADYYYPFEEEEIFTVSKTVPKSAANDLIAIRVGTVTIKDSQEVEGRGFWQEGTWKVVFKRSMKAHDPEVDALFPAVGGNLEGKRLCAFAAWNGSKGDRGGRKSISDWVELLIK